MFAPLTCCSGDMPRICSRISKCSVLTSSSRSGALKILSQTLHGAFVFQAQDQIARVALEAGADNAVFFSGVL